MEQDILIGILIPFAGTTLGAAMVFFLRREMNERLQKALLGFASGVMIAASVWSLLIPAIEMAEERDAAAWLPATIGFLLGMGFLLLLDALTPHIYQADDELHGSAGCSKKKQPCLSLRSPCIIFQREWQSELHLPESWTEMR